MPTGENIEPAGGRVTRSLRKRLTSIDSDLSSRPGTPNNINLQTIPETNTPKKRVTRRASLNTPSAMTPTKESTITPGRRLTRRSSVNFSETDEQALQVVSKEPTITVVKEEENEVETPNEKPKRVLRSTSKSPNDPENSKKSKQTSKKTTNQEEQEEQKKQDVIILDDSIEVYASKPASVKKNSRASIKKENLADEVETKKSENGSTPTKKSANLSATEKNLTPSPNRNGADIVSPVKSATKRDSLRKQNTPEQSKSDKGSGKKNKSAEKQKRLSDVKSSTLIFEKIETSQESPSNKNLSKTAAETGIAGLKRNHPEPLKNVAFFEAADENTVKNVYPKTPGLIKSKSYILDASNDVDKDETFKSKKDQSFEEKGTKSGKENSDEEETEGLNTKTPYKLKLMAVESSTPIQSSSPKHNNKTSEIQKQKEKSLMTEEEGVVAFPKSWNKSVSGKIRETPKIDCIISEKSLQEKQTQEKSNKSPSKSFKNSSKNKVHQHDSDVSDSADDMLEQDEFYDEENEENAERTIFLDDEAIEVADGEESMDSEERAYLEENEVPEYGESIGSQDSDDDDHCDEEPDEEDAAFVVSDTEVIQDDLSSEDEIETSNKSKKLDSSNQKKYKRIYQNLESSDEEANHTANKDETDFYLFVDSSVEEDNIENTKQPGDVKSPMKSFKNKANDSGVKNKSVKNKSLKEDNKLSNSKINKTVQDVSEKENEQEKSKAELPPKILSENDVSKKDMARETDVKNDADIVTQSKPETSEIDDVSQKNEQEPTEKLTKSPKMIIISGDNSDEDDLQKNEQEPVSKSPQKKKLTKSPKRKSTATIAQDESENDKQDEIEDEKQCKSTKNSRKSSVNKSIVCDDGFESKNEKSLNKSRKSVSESIDASANEESLNVSQIKSIDNSNPNKNSSFNEEKQNSKSRKSLNESRKSLIRTSTEETNDNLDQSTVENTKLSLEERFEPEDTLSAHENPLDISAGKSFNKSKNLRKSLDRNSSIVQNEQCNETEKSMRRKSIAQQNTIKNKTESSADSEAESEENLPLNLLKNKQSKEPEKSKRRKSIAQQSLTRKSSESSADSEDENVEKLTPDSLQNKQSNEPEKSKRRKSIAQQSLTRKSSESSADSEDENVEKLTSDSFQNKQSNEPEKFKRRKSIAQQSITRKSSESSADSEDENVEKLTPDSLQNKQSNKPEKSKRRKSIAQQSITRKDSESSADSEEQNDEKSSAEITDNEMESSHGDEVEAQFSDEENVATNRTISDFLGEEDKIGSPKKHNSSRRKSIVTNESKLDETFQLDPKSSLCSSLHESLHRSILRKSLNQSQKRKESTEANSSKDDINEEVNFSSNSEELDNSSEEEEFEIKKKIVAEKGLSVSLNSMQIKNKSVKDTKAIRNSFTIGVSVRKNFSEDEDSSEAEHVAENVASSKSENSSSSESKGLNLSEVNCLEKVKDVKNVGPYKSRKSMSNSIVLAPPSDGDINQKKRIKRTSLYLQEEAASNSFVENLAEEKKKINPKKRKSNSFCGAIAPSSAEDADNVPLKEPRSEKKLKKSIESENRDDNLKHVLSRCEQMIEAANEAKLQAKLQAKKVKVKKPKWMAKEEEASKEDETVEIPLVSKKEIKRKEKIKKELAKALKQSACVLSKVNEPVKKVKQKNPTSKLESNMNSTKRLETEFLESLVELSNPNKKKAKEIKTTPPSDKENSKKKSNKLKYRIEDIHTKIESDIETLETACGTVIVEPSTPQKLRFQHGFRESPKTPIGFKIQDIDARDKKKDLKCSRKLKTPSGAFIEDNITSSKKNNINQQKPRKRKYLQMEEPTYTLPKTQWTPSGVFVEEDLSNARPLANSTATQFLVASLKSGKKNKEVISSTTLNTALSFKKNALQKSKALRQPSREILNVKRREIVNNQF